MEITDSTLEQKISTLQASVQKWAEERGLWTDSGFTCYQERFEDEPNNICPCVTVMYSDGGIFNLLNGYLNSELLDEFHIFLDDTEFYCEAYNHYLFNFYCKEKSLNEAFIKYFEWQWILNIIQPDYTNLYQELFEYFRKNPEKMSSLHWRKYEIFISEIFKNQGYETLLGTGQNGEGVDLRIYQRSDSIDPLVTLVQIKRYAPNRPIDFQAVAALSGCVHTEDAKNGIFVTSSRYLPSAKRFAGRQNSKIILADVDDVKQWCQSVQYIIDADRLKAITDSYIKETIQYKFDDLRGKIFVADSGYTITTNDFAVVLKDSTYAVLMMNIPLKHIIATDGNIYTTGFHTPNLDQELFKYRTADHVFRAKKINDTNGKITLYAKQRFYYLWNGLPKPYDYND